MWRLRERAGWERYDYLGISRDHWKYEKGFWRLGGSVRRGRWVFDNRESKVKSRVKDMPQSNSKGQVGVQKRGLVERMEV